MNEYDYFSILSELTNEDKYSSINLLDEEFDVKDLTKCNTTDDFFKNLNENFNIPDNNNKIKKEENNDLIDNTLRNNNFFNQKFDNDLIDNALRKDNFFNNQKFELNNTSDQFESKNNKKPKKKIEDSNIKKRKEREDLLQELERKTNFTSPEEERNWKKQKTMIRNRLSAQQSRENNKKKLESLEEENR
jgi:hypothetical protein